MESGLIEVVVEIPRGSRTPDEIDDAAAAAEAIGSARELYKRGIEAPGLS
jgi:hypothetical protein